MLRYGTIATLLFLAFCVACDPSQETLAEYRPLEFDGDRFTQVSSTLVTEDHYDRVEEVLNFYGVAHRRLGPTSIEFEPPILSELVYNYGSKAEDEKWRSSHLHQSQ
jgi:hypothetical protein